MRSKSRPVASSAATSSDQPGRVRDLSLSVISSGPSVEAGPTVGAWSFRMRRPPCEAARERLSAAGGPDAPDGLRAGPAGGGAMGSASDTVLPLVRWRSRASSAASVLARTSRMREVREAAVAPPLAARFGVAAGVVCHPAGPPAGAAAAATPGLEAWGIDAKRPARGFGPAGVKNCQHEVPHRQVGGARPRKHPLCRP